MKKILLATAIIAAAGFSTAAEAGCKWVNGNRICTPAKKVVVVPRRSVVIKPVYHHHHAWVAFASTVGIALMLNDAGETVDSDGNKVIVLDTNKHTDESTQVLQKDGITYILN